MEFKTKKHLFNFIGAGLVTLWLVLIGFLLIGNKDLSQSDRTGLLDAGELPEVKSSRQHWMEIYAKDKKVGYALNRISPLGKKYLLRQEIFLKTNLLGQASGVHTVTRSVVDKAFLLQNFNFSITSGVVSFKVAGEVEGRRMRVTFGEGNSLRHETVLLADRPMISGALPHFLGRQELAIGDVFYFPVFDPSTMAQRNMTVRVAGKETLTILDIQHAAFRLEAEMWGRSLRFWFAESGVLLKEEGLMGLTLLRSNAERAVEGMQSAEGYDLYSLAAVEVNRTLKQAARLAYLKLGVKGFDQGGGDNGILDRGRQKLHSGVLEIFRETKPARGAYRIPYPDQEGKMRDFLSPEFNVESDSTVIVAKVRQIAGRTRDPVKVAAIIMRWVYQNVQKKPVLAVPSALEVLKSGVGDCNEHAVLATALLRAAGIPARICVGLVYARDKFYYHAWVEAYFGPPSAGGHSRRGHSEGWVSIDPTLNQMPADATHIKIVEGGLQEQTKIIRLIGQVKLEIMDYRYDQAD